MKKHRLTVTVALVDADEMVLDSVKEALEFQQWQVLTYPEGKGFLSDLKRHRPDCVVLDPHLPDLDGVEVARTLTVGHTPIPIIVLTAQPDSPVVSKIKDAGARAVLTKPISEEVLVKQINAAIATLH